MSAAPITDRRALAVETDTTLAALYGERTKIEQQIAWSVDALHRAVGDRTRQRFSGPWVMTLDEVLAFDTSTLAAWDQRSYSEALARYEAQTETLAANGEAIAALDRVWADNGMWHRYFLVNNNNGHVHRDQSCSTCFPTTQYLWLVDLADCDEEAMVAEYGELACSVCFPDAPAFKGYGDGTSAMARLSQAERDAKAAEKAAKQAAKDAKAITQPDGQPLRERNYTTGEPGQGSIIKTERSASIALTDALQNVLVFGYDEERFMPQARYLAEALAHKHGTTVEAVLADHEKKARKRK